MILNPSEAKTASKRPVLTISIVDEKTQRLLAFINLPNELTCLLRHPVGLPAHLRRAGISVVDSRDASRQTGNAMILPRNQKTLVTREFELGGIAVYR
jgi:hypothetical protein